MFELHSKLANDCFHLGEFQLTQLLMMNDNHFPWFILVPQRPNIQEIYQLTDNEQIMLTQETSYLANTIHSEFNAKKINTAALGNMVPQLHIHVIARFDSDIAWPHPVWGREPALPLEKNQLIERIDSLKKAFLKNNSRSFQWHAQWM